MGSKETIQAGRPLGIWFSLVYFAIAGVYAFFFAVMFDVSLVPAYIIGVVSLAVAAGLFLMKRWAVWLCAAAFPLILLASISPLYFSVSLAGWSPDWETGLFQASLILYGVFSFVSLMLVLDKRKEFK